VLKAGKHAVRVSGGRAAELDARWSFVEAKARARGLWQALDPHPGSVWADGVGARKEAVVLKLKALLAALGLTRYDTDQAGVEQRYLPPEQHPVGKLTLQPSARKHLTLRTRRKRLARRTRCFSRSGVLPDLIIGVYMHRVEFGWAVSNRVPTKLEHYPFFLYS
jgi:insertion element IS1 protein InsB